ncbi:hypothetical protein H2204_001083 [Knufia peltigerae]|uniref:Uncharacterized protein n=1 Tax=Knufia peltigerae TaxID=1002370 RepID=A0AA38YFD5_9EURO|nr:hypothetical protein H2204_001083 [Knufia peltigerae]
MASRSTVYGTLLVVLACAPQPGLTGPVPQIIHPDLGSLSLSELFLQTFRRIMELGFVQGVVSALLILGCLICMLICVLCALAAYFDRNDKGRWDRNDLELNDDYVYSSPREKRHADGNSTSSPVRRGRKAHHCLSRQQPVVTKISVVASPFSCRRKASSPPSPPRYHPQNNRTSSPPVTPLRSALSKSPSPPCQRHSVYLGVKRSPSSSASPKSVRWADELGVSVLATVQVTNSSSHEGTDWEIDIGMTRPQSTSAIEASDNCTPAADAPPAYTCGRLDSFKS